MIMVPYDYDSISMLLFLIKECPYIHRSSMSACDGVPSNSRKSFDLWNFVIPFCQHLFVITVPEEPKQITLIHSHTPRAYWEVPGMTC